jgi:replicative DNA helicase
MNSVPDTLPPFSQEAEDALLGSLLIDGSLLPLVRGFLAPADFFIMRNGWIYEALLAVADRGEEIDNITVAQELRNRDRLADAGGSGYLTALINSTPTSAHMDTYARLIERAAVRRRILTAAGNIATLMLSDGDLNTQVSESHAILTQASAVRQNGDFRPLSDIASEVYDEVEERHREGGVAAGIPTGLFVLDNIMPSQGWARGESSIIAGRPGMGKTSLALGCALKSALLGNKTAFMSLEMTANELHYRLLSMYSGVNGNAIKTGKMNEDQWARYMKAQEKLSTLPLFVDASSSLTTDQLDTRVTRLYRELGINLLFVDYLQLIYSERRTENRNQEVSEISRKLKQLALRFKIPVVSLCQLNRGVEERADKRPKMSDLRESGSLEQDADNIYGIYRDDYYHEDSECPGKADILALKQRNGGTGPVTVGWISSLTKFDNTTNINLEEF